MTLTPLRNSLVLTADINSPMLKEEAPMIPQDAFSPKSTWQESLKKAVSSVPELLALLEIPENSIDWVTDKNFPIRVPHSFVRRMKKGDPHCPLLKQVLSHGLEQIQDPAFGPDPLEEARPNSKTNPLPGLLHKFEGRVLLTLTSACAIHCRFCFRKHFPYAENRPNQDHFEQILEYIAARPEINEVILSGGDPLSVPDDYLGKIIKLLETIPHLKYLRIHTRFPIVIPERLTPNLAKYLSQSRLSPCLVLHCNHPNELSTEVLEALTTFKKSGVLLLNQSVLLAGVNDSQEILISLMEKLYSAGVLPYYLHLLDRVSGTKHFEVSEKQACILMRNIAGKLPGFLLPKLVREVPGAPSKVPIIWLN